MPIVRKYIKALEKDAGIILKPYKEQSEITNLSAEDIQMAQGYIYCAVGKPKKINF